MKTHANKTPQNGSKANGHAIADTENRSEAIFQFVDNRPVNAMQRRLKQGNQPVQLLSSVVQRDVPNSAYKGDYAEEIEAYVDKLNQAVLKAWGWIIKTPTLGSLAKLNGYTQLWVEKIKDYGETKIDPGGLHTAFGYAVESLVSGPLLPTIGDNMKVIQQGARGSTRPDLVIQHNNVDIAWLDITASSSAGHIFTKAGAWDQSPSCAEITYPSIGTSDLLDMANTANDNPEAEIGGDMDLEEYLARKERADQELEEKMAQWKEILTDLLKPVKKIGGPFVPDDGPPRRKKTIQLLENHIGDSIPEKTAPHILAAAGLNSSVYGFRTGFPANASTGVSYLLDKPI
ncbi:hypothetical protein BXY85_0119 [Roseivirga pacifica]|uniref:Uncharacterized protein n=1 Tax=Roseivirga pacifica TaxID=1267423 RepID=A0A1I0R6U0_9BACT|nr:hypothetical protein [Roseivirga pacifica]RKQ49131.1 hypothetical protein BXY85_0119 [Roseivirga pacifica]SEW36377.1 hypothetical protein SAMN05216290_3172 [Roseivirga pacifica]